MHYTHREYAITELTIKVDKAMNSLPAKIIDLTFACHTERNNLKPKEEISSLHAVSEAREALSLIYWTLPMVKATLAQQKQVVPIWPEGIYAVKKEYEYFAWLQPANKKGLFSQQRQIIYEIWPPVADYQAYQSIGLRNYLKIIMKKE